MEEEKPKEEKMTVAEARDKLKVSKLQKQYTPTLMAVVITLQADFNNMEASQVCAMLGVPESYKHTVRALLQVPAIIKGWA